MIALTLTGLCAGGCDYEAGLNYLLNTFLSRNRSPQKQVRAAIGPTVGFAVRMWPWCAPWRVLL